eukprot:TRINITY_DN1592_c0_g1_i2.p1 TRINITY_DN1592_c0_g1~~TRINITY_DN1592_c0_g1_i2.p1  ORF type:complete len:671 (+),score=150.22 TRINITY_DN1592_c0_g1_i2:388-2400(+)
MESGVVKLTPQWLSFANNQPPDDQKRNGLQDSHRERYGDRTRYNNFSGRTSQTKTERTSDVRSSSGNINTSAGASPPRLGRSKSLNTLKKEPNETTPSTLPPTSVVAEPAVVISSSSVSDVLDVSSPLVDDTASSPTPNDPPKSSYDKHFPALGAQKKSKSTPSDLVVKKEDSAKSPPVSSPSRTASPPPAAPNPTNNPSLKSLTKPNNVTIPSVTPATTVTTSVSTSPSPSPAPTTTTPAPTPLPSATSVNPPAQPNTIAPPTLTKQKSLPLASWTGPAQVDAPTKATPSAVATAPITAVTSPTPIVAPVAVAPSLFRTTPKAATTLPVATSVKIAPSPSPSPPPIANIGKSPAVIIREAPKAIPVKTTVAPAVAPAPALSHEIERAKSLIPSQPIVPKPLAKNHHQNAKNQSKQPNGQNGQRPKQLVKKSSVSKLEASVAFGSLLSSADNASQDDQDQQEPVKTVQKDPVKLLPRNNFFENLRKQEEQKRKGLPEKDESIPPSNSTSQVDSVKAENGHSTNRDAQVVSPSVESKTSESEVASQTEVSKVAPTNVAQVQDATTQTSKPDAQATTLKTSSDALPAHLQLSEEEEQRLLKQFGWTPDDDAGSDDDDYSIPDEEIQALKNQLNLHKESLTQKRETRLNSLAQSVEQWQQRLLSSTTTPIKSP